MGHRSERRNKGLLRLGGAATAFLAIAVALSGCGRHGAPHGQVVAVIGGQEVTYQDLAAQSRIDGGAREDAKALLQKVVGRVLLAQEAKRRGLDRYPGYPSDLAAIQQNFLAQKEARTIVKPVATPTSAQVSSFIAARPATFARREKIALNEIVVHDALDRKAIQGPDSLDQLERKLNTLNVTFEKRQLQVDTAELPLPLATRLLNAPDNALSLIEGPRETLAFAVISRTPAVLPPEAEQAVAVRLIEQQGQQQQLNQVLQQLGRRSRIAYQPGFAPGGPGKVESGGPTGPDGNTAS